MASTFTFKEGSLIHCILVLRDVTAPTEVNVVFLPPTQQPSIPPGSPFPSVTQTLLQVLPQPSPPSCLLLPGTPPPPRQPPQHILGATAAQSFPQEQPTAWQQEGDGERSPHLARGRAGREFESHSHNHPATLSSPFRFLQAQSRQHSLLH